MDEFTRTDRRQFDVTRSGGAWGSDPDDFRFPEWIDPEFPSESSGISSAEVASMIDSRASGLREFVAKRFLEVPNTAAVAFQYGQDVLHVWTVVTRWVEAELERVYELELELMDRFEGQRFDFYVVLSADRPIESLLREDGVYVLRRDHADR